MMLNEVKHINPLVLYQAEYARKVGLITCTFILMTSVGLQCVLG